MREGLVHVIASTEIEKPTVVTRRYFLLSLTTWLTDLGMRRALADTVQHASAQKTTADIIQQWQKLLIEPIQKLSESTVGPVVIVIDTLDESDVAKIRCDLSRIRYGKLQNSAVPQIMELLKNFRFIITSCPLREIQNAFGCTQHIRSISMDGIQQKSWNTISMLTCRRSWKRFRILGAKSLGPSPRKLMVFSNGHVLLANPSKNPLLAYLLISLPVSWCPTILLNESAYCTICTTSFY